VKWSGYDNRQGIAHYEQAMKTVIQSLSFTSGAILLAFVSAAIVWLLCSIFPVALRKLWAAIVPLVLAYCLYWSPVWFNGEPSSEYHIWMFAFLIPWFLAGAVAVPSAVVVWILEKRRPNKGL
jgi:hypothetical protein